MSYNRRIDKAVFKKDLDSFIPLACHIDERTILTKNGEIIQIVEIEGIANDSPIELAALRTKVRNVIQGLISKDLAFWIHTIREKKNLNDDSTYPNFLSENIHRIWCEKNYWDNRLVNTLYISIVYVGARIDTNNLSGFLNSFFVKKLYNFHNNYIENATAKLTKIVNSVLDQLKEFKINLLQINEEDNVVISYPMAFLNKVLHLKDRKFEITEHDLSSTISDYNIAIGSNKLEILSNHHKRFAGILSLKGYQDLSDKNIDIILQLPIEMIITEVFYDIKQNTVQSFYQEQHNVTKIRGNKNLNQIKCFDIMFDQNNDNNLFCNQQIHITCITDSIDNLDKQIAVISEGLFKLGVMHVLEDINLESAYWAQIPSNFSFLKRLYPNFTAQTCAFSSLHMLPFGRKKSKWGEAMTILRTARGTPYFFNLHDQQSHGHTFIAGQDRSGRTTLINFLLSESTKYRPKILHIHVDHNSDIFLQSLGALESQELKNISPIYGNKNNMSYIKQLIKMMFNALDKKLTTEDEKAIEDCANYLHKAKGSLQDFVTSYNFSKTTESLKQGFNFFASSQCNNFFNIENKNIIFEHDIVSINLFAITEKMFAKNHYPNDKKLLDKYNQSLEHYSNLRSMVVYSLINDICNTDIERPKIIVIDNLFQSLSSGSLYRINMEGILKEISNKNAIIIASANINNYSQQYQSDEWQNFIKLFNTKLMLASEIVEKKFQYIFSLTKEEYNIFVKLLPRNRMFILKQDKHFVPLELSLGGLSAIIKILSAGKEEIEIFNKIKSQFGTRNDQWLENLYEEFNKEI